MLAGCSGAVSPCGCVALQITFSLRILLDITGIPFKLLVSNLLGLLNFPVTRLCKNCFGFPSKFSLLPAACLCHICAHCAAAGSAVPPRLGSAKEPPDDLAASQRWPASQVAKFCHPFSATWAKRPSREASGRQGAPGFHFPSPPALVWALLRMAASRCGLPWGAPGLKVSRGKTSRRGSWLLKFSPHVVCFSVDS